MPTIESDDLTLAEVFKDFYSVPDYQREYVWDDEQVNQLLSDIRIEQADGNGSDYFIGSIVTCPGPANRFDLIDGQQRMTTIFVSLCALRDRLDAVGDTQLATVRRLIADEKTDERGQDTYEGRIQLQYEDADDIFEALIRGDDISDRSRTRSIANIARAYRTALEFYAREFGERREELRQFYGYLINRVKLIRVKTDSLARALKIFETINDRGVGLDAMDLLKNLLFMKANPAEFDKLKRSWKALVDALYGAQEKPLRFLRYYILSTFGVDKIREDELYSWLVKNETRVGYGTKPLTFVQSLTEAAGAYLNFLKGLGASGARDPAVESLSLLAGKSTRQQLIILLGARALAPDVFAAVCRDVEQLIFAYLIARQTNREFEVMFPSWAVELRKIRSLEEYEPFAERTFRKRRAELAERFLREFSSLDSRDLKKFHLRYIVGKITQAVDLAGFGYDSEGHKWLSRYTDPANHIEHIAPQTPSDDSSAEFGVGADDSTVIWAIGNLALAEGAINGSLGQKPFSQKGKVYPQSQFLLTRSISSKVEVGRNTAIDRAVADLEPYSEWNAGNVKERNKTLAHLAAKVWDVQIA